MTTTITIPSTLSDLTPRWFSQLMSLEHPGVVVTDAQVSEFLGHKPNKARVRLTYNEAGRTAGLPASVFVKGGFKGTHSASVSGLAAGLDVGTELELMAYLELVPLLAVNTPRHYGAMFDPVSYTGIVVLEDLALSEASFLSSAAHLNHGQAAAFIDALARMHAPWFGSRELGEADGATRLAGLIERTARIHQLYFDHMASGQHWPEYMSLPRAAALPRAFQDATRFAAGQKRLEEIHRSCARTIIHGDEHLGNLYFSAKGDPGFLDWCARIEPWPISFAYFLIVTTDPLDRRQWERALLERYLQQLTAHGARVPGFEEAWHVYRASILYPTLAWLINSPKYQPESVNTRNAVRGAIAMLDHGVFELLGV